MHWITSLNFEKWKQTWFQGFKWEIVFWPRLSSFFMTGSNAALLMMSPTLTTLLKVATLPPPPGSGSRTMSFLFLISPFNYLKCHLRQRKHYKVLGNAMSFICYAYCLSSVLYTPPTRHPLNTGFTRAGTGAFQSPGRSDHKRSSENHIEWNTTLVCFYKNNRSIFFSYIRVL